MINDMVKDAYEAAIQRKWNRIYIAVDIHSTIAESNYKNTLPDVIPEAVAVIKKLQQFPEIRLILWSSCYAKDHQTYIDHFAKHGMNFVGFNSNPEVPNTETGDFSVKFYFNLLIDDKAGFRSKHWKELFMYIVKYRKGIEEFL